MAVDFIKSEKDGATFVTPELARTFSEIGDNGLYENPKTICELKINGWRLETSRSLAMSRTLKPKCVEFLQNILDYGMILDGELALRDPGTCFSDVAHCIASEQDKLKYVVFDIISHADHPNLLDYPWSKRRNLLEKVFDKILSPRIELNEIISEGKRDFVDFVEENGYEGVVFKNIDGRYCPGQRDNWVKYKMTEEWDAVIVDAEGKPTGAAPVAAGNVILRYGFYDNDTMKLIAVGGTGMSMSPKDAVKYIGRVAVIKGYGINPSGAITHPHVEYFRDDKPARHCRFDFRNGKYVEYVDK